MRRAIAAGVVLAALAAAGFASATHTGADFWLHCQGAPVVCAEEAPPTATTTATVTVTAPAPTTTVTTTEPPPPPPPPPPTQPPPTQPPAPETWSVEPPREPVTVRDGVSIGVNAGEPIDAHDYRIVDSGDSSVILHRGAHGSSVRRFDIVRAGLGNTVWWGKHGVYAKVRDALLEDVHISTSPYAADCVTLRMAGAFVSRLVCEGAPPHVATYFQENDLGLAGYTRGVVRLQHVRGTFRGNTAFWVAVNGALSVQQAFVLHDVHVNGPEGAAFLRVLHPTFAGSSVTISGCSTLNGVPVTPTVVDIPLGTPLSISCP